MEFLRSSTHPAGKISALHHGYLSNRMIVFKVQGTRTKTPYLVVCLSTVEKFSVLFFVNRAVNMLTVVD